MKKFIVQILIILLAGSCQQAYSQIPESRIYTARLFLEYFSSGRASDCYALLDPGVQSKISVEQLEQLWKAIEFQMGSLESTGAVRTELSEEYAFVYIPCNFTNISVDLRVVFPADGDGITGFFFAPPAVTGSYKIPSWATDLNLREIITEVQTDTFRLPATLMLPEGEGPFPLVVMVHGSGPSDRDASLGPNKIFSDLALGLASRGIASLRYEKRTRVYGTRLDVEKLTLMEETIEDVLSAIDSFRNHPGIDPQKVFILGHSLGGYAAPWISRLAGEKIAGAILMAAGASPLQDLVLSQYTYLYALDSISQKETEHLEKLKEQVILAGSRKLGPETPAASLPLGLPAAYWLALRKYNPVKTAARLSIPLLMVHAGRDYQVPRTEWELWKKGLVRKKNVEWLEFPGLNHLFLRGQGRPEPSEYLLPGNVPREVIDSLANWIL